MGEKVQHFIEKSSSIHENTIYIYIYKSEIDNSNDQPQLS